MFLMNLFRRNPRRYASRLPPASARRAMMSLRIHESARRSIHALAEKQGMSMSEYVCRLLNEHLREAAPQHASGPLSWSRG